MVTIYLKIIRKKYSNKNKVSGQCNYYSKFNFLNHAFEKMLHSMCSYCVHNNILLYSFNEIINQV